ncbi:MAG: TonB-dependent receptor [Bacteroides sp.]|nr:TonB-dependent receptor [Bacteroides sp.]
MKGRFFLTILIHVLCLPLFSQENTLTGTIINQEDQKPLAQVNILIRSRETNKVITFGISDASGKFRITVPAHISPATPLTISFTYIGFETITQDLTDERTFHINMRPAVIQIKEVKVKVQKIRAQGDTIIYNVASYAKDYDKSIGDVLKKLPGVDVKDNGQIHYNGVPINKFYIEGLDLLEGKYGVATNSIHNKNVSTVEVLQEHQPVRALEGLSFSDQAAINLRLKENARQRWIGTVQGALGVTPLLWDAELSAMKFTRKLQSLNVYKTNNTGKDIIRQSASFDLKELRNKSHWLPDYITAIPPASLGLERKRELFNRSHLITTNNLTKLKNDFNLKLHAAYVAHNETGHHTTETTYYNSQQETVRISEKENAHLHEKQTTFGVVLEANKPRYNLTNKFNSDFTWMDRDMAVKGTFPNDQQLSSSHHRLSNDLYLLRRLGKDFITFESYTLYQNHPQQFSVVRSSSSQIQDIHQSSFFTNNKAGYGFVMGRVVTTFTTGASVMRKTLQTDLQGVESSTMPHTGQTAFSQVHAYVTPRTEFRWHGIETTLSLPLNHYAYTYKNRITDERSTYNTLTFNPALRLRMNVTPRLRVSVLGEVSRSEVNDRLFHPAILLNDYRSLTEGFPEFLHRNKLSFTGDITYKKPLNELFSGLTLLHSRDKSPYTLHQTFAGEYMVSSYAADENKSQTWFLNAFFNKGIDLVKGYLFLNASYVKKDGKLIRDDARLPYTQNSFMFSPKLETHFTRWLVVNYTFNYSLHTMSSTEASDKIKNHQLSQSLLIRILPASPWRVGLLGEHYCNEIFQTGRKHFLLTDLNLTYKINKTTEVALHINNLLDQKNYAYTSFSDDLTTIYRNYRIRPRNILLSTHFHF